MSYDEIEEFQEQACYRHPERMTGLSCNRCGKPICANCAVSSTVGYRCPDCTYELQNRYFTDRKGDYINPFAVIKRAPTILTYLLVATIGMIWGWQEAAGGSTNPEVLVQFGAMYGPNIFRGEYWRFFTAMFLHIGLVHLLFNGFALYIFGREMELLYGTARFGFIYLLAGVCGNVVSFASRGLYEFSAGASGAVFGIIGMNAAFFFFHRKRLGQVGKAQMQRTAQLVVLNLIIGFSIPNINNLAHIGGLIGGMIFGYIFVPRHRPAVGDQGNYAQDLGTLSRMWWATLLSIVVVAGGVWATVIYWQQRGLLG